MIFIDKREINKIVTANVDDAIAYLNLDMSCEIFTRDDLIKGMAVELAEHGYGDYSTNIINGNPIKAAQIALAHLRENPKYYTFLEGMERAMDATNGVKTNCTKPNGTWPTETVQSGGKYIVYRLNIKRLKTLIN